MSLGAYQAIAGIVGVTQQKGSQVAHDRQVHKAAVGTALNRAEGSPGSVLSAGTPGSDSTSITRAAIVALQSTSSVNDESVIRDDREARETLEYSKSQILERSEAARAAQANQTPQQLLNLYSG